MMRAAVLQIVGLASMSIAAFLLNVIVGFAFVGVGTLALGVVLEVRGQKMPAATSAPPDEVTDAG